MDSEDGYVKSKYFWDEVWWLQYSEAKRERFKKWDKANPKIRPAFEKMAAKIKTDGRKRYSAYDIFSVIRWHRDIKTVGDNFKIHNDYIPIYVRILIHNHREFLGFFVLRPIGSKSDPVELKEEADDDD